MNTILYIKTFIVAFLYQTALVPEDNTNLDAAPIDDYWIVGLIVAVLFIVLYKYMQKPAISK